MHLHKSINPSSPAIVFVMLREGRKKRSTMISFCEKIMEGSNGTEMKDIPLRSLMKSCYPSLALK